MSSQPKDTCLDSRTQLVGKYYVARLRFHPDPNMADSFDAFDSVVAIINRGNTMMNYVDLKNVVVKNNRLGLRTPLVLGSTMSEHSTCTYQDCLDKLEDLVSGGMNFTSPPYNPSSDVPPYIFRDRPLSFVDFCLLSYKLGRLPNPEGLAIIESFAATSNPAVLPLSIPGAYYVPPGSGDLPSLVASNLPPSTSSPPSSLSYSDAARGGNLILQHLSHPPPPLPTLNLGSDSGSSPAQAPPPTTSLAKTANFGSTDVRLRKKSQVRMINAKESSSSVSNGAQISPSPQDPNSNDTSHRTSPSSNSPSPQAKEAGFGQIPGVGEDVFAAEEYEVQDLQLSCEISDLVQEVANDPSNQDKTKSLIKKMKDSIIEKDRLNNSLHAQLEQQNLRVNALESSKKSLSKDISYLSSTVGHLVDSVEQLGVNICSSVDQIFDDADSRYSRLDKKIESILLKLGPPSDSESSPTPASSELQINPQVSMYQSSSVNSQVTGYQAALPLPIPGCLPALGQSSPGFHPAPPPPGPVLQQALHPPIPGCLSTQPSQLTEYNPPQSSQVSEYDPTLNLQSSGLYYQSQVIPSQSFAAPSSGPLTPLPLFAQVNSFSPDALVPGLMSVPNMVPGNPSVVNFQNPTGSPVTPTFALVSATCSSTPLMSTHQTSPLAYSALNGQYSTPPPFSSPIPSHGGNRNLTNPPVFKRPLSSPTTPLTARPPPRPRPMIAQHFITSTPPPPIRGSSTNAPVTTSQQRGQYSRYNNGQFYKT